MAANLPSYPSDSRAPSRDGELLLAAEQDLSIAIHRLQDRARSSFHQVLGSGLPFSLIFWMRQVLSVDAVEQIFDVVVSYLNFTSSLFATPLLVTSTGLLTLPNYGRGMFCVDFRVFCPNIP